jgi:uncharacterized damage-inducible protein DinB
MIPMIRMLFCHKAWADAAILSAARANSGAAEDEFIRSTLHHTLVTQRFFLALLSGRVFDLESEVRGPLSLDELTARYRRAHDEAVSFLARLEESELAREFDLPHASFRRSMRDCLLQVAMHSQHHRGQCASRLRALGVTPPTTDFILWVGEQPAPSW